MIAHFATLDSENKVLNILAVDQADVDANGGDQSIEAENWVKTNLLKNDSAIVKQFSIDNSFRANGAQPLGGYYDPTNNVFIEVKPFDSWSLNNTTWKWEAPIEKPDNFTDPLIPDYSCAPAWDEANQQWISFDANEDQVVWNPSTSSWE